jgi:hypothetical protein
MSDLTKEKLGTPDELTAKIPLNPTIAPRGKVVLLPGIIAIAFYMLVLAAVVSFGVAGGHIPALFLVVAALFVAASFGLLRLFRWAWALTLAAAFSLMTWYFWILASTRQPIGGVMGVLNLVFFFYLIRVDVRSRLR